MAPLAEVRPGEQEMPERKLQQGWCRQSGFLLIHSHCILIHSHAFSFSFFFSLSLSLSLSVQSLEASSVAAAAPVPLRHSGGNNVAAEAQKP